MAFVPRTFETILTDMIAHVQANTVVSDFTVGSICRTILEAAALEDDEQYFQMVQLLDMFSLVTARGADLDRRLADFKVTREPAKAAVVPVLFSNNNLITEQIAIDAAATATSIVLFSTTEFPSSGYPYTVRLAEHTPRVQDVSVTNNDTATATLTCTALDNAMQVGDRATLVDPSSSYSISIGTVIRTAPTSSQAAKTYITLEPAFIIPGNFYSNEVRARAQATGTVGNVGAGKISQFQGSAPFPGCGVRNTQKAGGGRARETDAEFRERGLNKIQALSKGTKLAVRTGAIGVSDPVTSQRVVSANIIENFTTDEVVVYVDDGTGLDPDVATLPGDSLTASVTATVDSTLTLDDASDWPSTGKVIIIDGTDIEVLEYSSKSGSVLNLTSTVSFNHTVGTIVYLCEIVSEAAENGQQRFKLKHFPVVRGTPRVFRSAVGDAWEELAEFTDFAINKGTGEFKVLDDGGLDLGTEVVAIYSYYTNLIAEVQRVLEGDLANPDAYPGIKACGVFMSVEAPIIKRITVRASITAAPGFSEVDLTDAVTSNIEGYVNSLKIGEDVIRSKIVDVAHNVRGLADIVVITPTSNVVVLENELPVASDAAGVSLVTVT